MAIVPAFLPVPLCHCRTSRYTMLLTLICDLMQNQRMLLALLAAAMRDVGSLRTYNNPIGQELNFRAVSEPTAEDTRQ